MKLLPGAEYFKPRGIPLHRLQEVGLAVEEVEAIRLADLEGLSQDQGGQRMGVSQPTFHRILLSAHRKVAEALVGGKALRIEGGDFEMDGRKFTCSDCGHVWEVPFGTGGRCLEMTCPRCQSRNIDRTDQGGFGFGRARGGPLRRAYPGGPPGPAGGDSPR